MFLLYKVKQCSIQKLFVSARYTSTSPHASTWLTYRTWYRTTIKPTHGEYETTYVNTCPFNHSFFCQRVHSIYYRLLLSCYTYMQLDWKTYSIIQILSYCLAIILILTWSSSSCFQPPMYPVPYPYNAVIVIGIYGWILTAFVTCTRLLTPQISTLVRPRVLDRTTTGS